MQAGQGYRKTPGNYLVLTAMFKGIVASYIITIPLFIFFALVLTYTNFPEKYVESAVLAVTVLSVLAAGFTTTRSIGSKGWLNGGIVGLIYMIILYILNCLIYQDFSINRRVLTMLLIGVLSGSVGGIVGINVGNKRRYRYKVKR